MPKYASMACALMWPLLVLLLHDDVGSWPLLIIGAALLAWRMPQARYLAAAAAVLLVALGGLGHAELGMRGIPCGRKRGHAGYFSLPACGEECRSSNVWRAYASPSCPPLAYAIPRNVTWAWCGFFILNGAIASWTALYASLATWTLYNGAISYGLIAVMFTGEWLVRHQLRSRLT